MASGTIVENITTSIKDSVGSTESLLKHGLKKLEMARPVKQAKLQ